MLNKRIVWIILLAVLSLTFMILFEKTRNNKIQKILLGADEPTERNNFRQIGLTPLTFIGGFLRSGTTLMRTMLDVHPDVTCGPETFIIPKVLGVIIPLIEEEEGVLNGSGLLDMGKYGNLSILDQTVQQFIYNMVVEGKKPSKYYCNKDPMNLLYLKYISSLLPNSKFILMVRDFRAVAHSLLLRDKTPIYNTYRKNFPFLNEIYEIMVAQCETSDQCIMQKYEQLVLQPIKETKKIFNFLNIPWTKEVLYHDKHLDLIRFNSFELTTADVRKPLYLDGLTKWVGKIPNDVLDDLEKLAPIMVRLGYDVKSKTPYYGEPDDFVLKVGEWKED